MTTTNHKVAFGAKAKPGRSRNADAPGRLPRVTKLMALAIRLDQLIRDGVVADQAEIARLGYVSRARLTQIMDLLLLAPDIQEAILELPPGKQGHSCISEHDVRPIAANPYWEKQRQMWRSL
ncbi:hypothetical protein FYK55_28395 [Roseiconus nitratireducens]|uniref:Uncharacterized protein n=1 Tax=Roseiconus nitratireducens TaxID=2605748 RepID=A0A5M6CKL2_9BACT|nr:hypothetical protein [Roseiconus nitratireducens]KAA5535674.1 hypothetical protein FYK55_28395 [Roseiconus nitratireducens]